jgi:amino acid transporter
MSTSGAPALPPGGLVPGRLRPAQVLLVTSVMFTFISYWRTAAVVLCDLGSTAYYIGAIVEQSIGPAAPWFILAVMFFSYTVRWVYIESCTLFVRGGVYRAVREALGRFAAKIAVSALLFDYVLTGPISSVTAGQYLISLVVETLKHYGLAPLPHRTETALVQWGSVLLACLVTLYFFRKNLIGIHESSDKALKIMLATTAMVVVVFVWCGITLAVDGPKNSLLHEPSLAPKHNYSATDPDDAAEVDPTGFLSGTALGRQLHGLSGSDWLSLVGLIGLFIAFGHSILAMSGEETLAQVYREVEAPKVRNFKRAAFVVFAYSLVFTAGISFLAVLLIPDAVRMEKYHDNLIGGLAMNMVGPVEARLLLNLFVCVVGFLILSGAVNTAIIGSNGVLNRVAEDGVLHSWFLKPHPRYGTTYRLLYLILGLQLFTIVVSRGRVLWLGEAYAFGVVWSFVFQALAMVVLRFKDRRPREFKVPLNLRVRGLEIPVGLLLILLILLLSAFMNLLTKEAATVGGLLFTGLFFALFTFSERYHERLRRGVEHEHREQFNRQTAAEVTPDSFGLARKYRKLVAIRSPYNLFMLEKALAETDPETTGVVVMTAKFVPPGGFPADEQSLDDYDQKLMTAVVQRAEQIGKYVRPLIVPTNNPLFAVLQTAKNLQAHELLMGASNKYTADEQLDQIGFYWINLHGGQPAPLTVRVLSRERDIYLDLAGGNRIPKISERQARSVAELRAAGVGVDRVLLLHDGSPASSDLFQAVLTMLDPQVMLALVPAVPAGTDTLHDFALVQQDRERSQQLERELHVLDLKGDLGAEIVRVAREGQYDLIILPLPPELPDGKDVPLDERTSHVLRHAHCRVLLASTPRIPDEVVDTSGSPSP